MRSGLPCKPGTRVALSLAIVVILGRTETALGADDLQRRWLVLRTEGPVGAVRALAFSPDSSCLYAAGLDKCVHTWSLRTSPEGVVNARHTRYLQWEVSRANRGCFYAMAVASDGWIAAAGTSARDATGDIVLFDPATHQIAEMLPSSRPVSSKTPPTGHGDVVVSLAFSPSGEHLASVDMAGEVRIWSAQDGFGSESSVLRRGDRRYSSAQQPAVFLDDQLLAVAHRDVATGKHSVRIYDVKRRAFKQDIATDYPVNGRVVSRRVVSLGRDPFHPHRWAFATEAGNVEFRMGARRAIHTPSKRCLTRVGTRLRNQPPDPAYDREDDFHTSVGRVLATRCHPGSPGSCGGTWPGRPRPLLCRQPRRKVRRGLCSRRPRNLALWSRS